jgi:fructose-bisphosphate aldolase class II
MTLVTLDQVLRPCLAQGGGAIAGFVVLGWEDAQAYVQAARAQGRPVILQAGPGCRAHTPLPVLGAMFRALAQDAGVPVVAHLDHGEDIGVCAQAIECGFTSVMYDGSSLPLLQNIAQTREIARMAHSKGVSIEAELGFVGYDGGAASAGTDPAQVAQFARETGVDALAVSVGNTHLMQSSGAQIDMPRLTAIAQAAPNLPLVLHGGSGLDARTRRALALQTTVCKFNIGTQMRMAFGAALRETLSANPDEFDRIKILRATTAPVARAAQEVIANLAP